jgi:hypothetical protein
VVRISESEATPDSMATSSLLAGRVFLAREIEEGIEPPEELEAGVLLKGRVHQVYAGPGIGKSWVGLWLAARQVARGERVIYFDTENGPRVVAERLGALRVDTSELDELFFYLPSPNLALTAERSAAYAALLDTVTPALIVFDSWITFLATAGLDENSAVDIASWAINYAHPARDRGVTVVLLDHVPHAGNHSRGSTRKKDEVDVQYRLSRVKPFDRNTVGEIVLHREKDREAWLPPSARFIVGGDGTAFVFSRADSAGEPESTDELVGKRRSAFEVLCSFGDEGAGFNQWHRAAGVSRSTLSISAKELVRMGLVRKGDDKKYRAVDCRDGKGPDGSANHYRTEPNPGKEVRFSSPPLRGEPNEPPPNLAKKPAGQAKCERSPDG